MQRLGLVLLAFVAFLGCEGCAEHDLRATWNRVRGDTYALDDQSRSVGDAGPRCPAVPLTVYESEHFDFRPTAKVAEPFGKRLRRFEAVVQRLSQNTFGRAPASVVHAGTYACRTVAHRPGRLSEHALGNAIDVVGFDFNAIARDADAGAVPADLRGRIRIRVARHWDDPGPRGVFLRALSVTLDDEDVFRSIIGPAAPRHATHLHLDMAPWSYVTL